MTSPPANVPAASAAPRLWPSVLLGLIGLGGGLSPLFDGYVDLSTWAWVLVVVALVLIAVALAAYQLPVGLPAGLALAGLGGLAAWRGSR